MLLIMMLSESEMEKLNTKLASFDSEIYYTDDSGDLSTGAIVGIVIAAVTGSALLGYGIYRLVKRYSSEYTKVPKFETVYRL